MVHRKVFASVFGVFYFVDALEANSGGLSVTATITGSLSYAFFFRNKIVHSVMEHRTICCNACVVPKSP